jgi:hypothetical protein
VVADTRLDFKIENYLPKHLPNGRWIGGLYTMISGFQTGNTPYEMNTGGQRAWTGESRISIAFHVVK